MEQVYRIGIDHGYGNIKTAHHIFESGVIERERASELAGMTVEYEGKFYEMLTVRLSVKISSTASLRSGMGSSGWMKQSN